MKTVPSLDRHFVTTVADHFRRLVRLENWAATQFPQDITAPFPGTISTAITPRFQFPKDGNLIIGLAATLDTAGTSTTTIDLLKNGSVVSGSTLSLASGAHSGSTTLTAPGVAFGGPYTDYLQVEVTAAGTGAAGLLVHVWWR